MGDLRRALRQLVRAPGFTAVAVSTLALGIGACAAIFSVVDGVLLRPLPFPGADRLVAIQETLLPRFPEFAVAPAHYLEWQKQAASFEGLAALHDASYNVTGVGADGAAIHVPAKRVTASLLATLRVQPALGRAFTADEDVPGSEQVVMVSDGFWRRHLGGDRGVLGRTLALDGRPFVVVGVMPAGFALGSPADLFTPAAYRPSGVHDIAAIARLRDGVTLDEAQAEMAVIAQRVARATGGARAWGVKLTPLRELVVRDVRRLVLALAGAAVLLLLVACANAASLLATRAIARSRELAVRVALGASRARVVRQLLAESVVLALLAASLGVLLARVAVNVLVALAPEGLPRRAEIAIDARVLAFACLVALVTGIGFGLAPALSAARVDLALVLEEGGRTASGRRRHGRLRRALTAAALAIALVLLAAAALLGRSFVQLQAVPRGFHPDGAVAVTVSLPSTRYPTGAEQSRFAERATASLAAAPGIAVAAAGQGFPLSTLVNHVFQFRIAGRPGVPDPPTADAFSVTGDYFRALGIPLRRGRLFDQHDGENAERVTVINEALARRFFPGEDPIGKLIDAVRRGPPRWHRIVGVVGDVRYGRLDGEVPMQAYAPIRQGAADWGALTFIVRSAGAGAGAGAGADHDPRTAAPLAATIRAAIRAVDGGQAVTSIRPVAALTAASVARERFALVLFLVFSGVALVLAALGVHGVMAQSVALRTREMAIRQALGAQRRDVLRLVVGEGARIVALGLVTGVAGALSLTRLLGSLLFGVAPGDPLTVAGVAAFLAATGVCACLLAARRATAVDALAALRSP